MILSLIKLNPEVRCAQFFIRIKIEQRCDPIFVQRNVLILDYNINGGERYVIAIIINNYMVYSYHRIFCDKRIKIERRCDTMFVKETFHWFLTTTLKVVKGKFLQFNPTSIWCTVAIVSDCDNRRRLQSWHGTLRVGYCEWPFLCRWYLRWIGKWTNIQTNLGQQHALTEIINRMDVKTYVIVARNVDRLKL